MHFYEQNVKLTTDKGVQQTLLSFQTTTNFIAFV